MQIETEDNAKQSITINCFCVEDEAGVLNAPENISRHQNCGKIIRTRNRRRKEESWYQLDYKDLKSGVTTGFCGCGKQGDAKRRIVFVKIKKT